MNRSTIAPSSTTARHQAGIWWFLVAVLALGAFFLLGITPSPVASAPGLTDAAIWNIVPTNWTDTPAVTVVVTDTDGLQEYTAEYRYATDGGTAWTDWTLGGALQAAAVTTSTVRMTVTIPSLVESATRNVVQFRLADNLLNVETSPEHVVKLDSFAPAAPLSLVADPSGWTAQDEFDLSWTNPGDTSGIVSAYCKVGDTPPADPADYGHSVTGADVSTFNGITLGASGQKTAYVWLQDASGNLDHTRYAQVTLSLDQTAPASPIGLSATPAGWVSANGFDLNWTNPVQGQASIGTAYFKFESAPSNPTDYAGFVAGADINSLIKLAAPDTGEIPCYVWLGDAAGNADHTTAVSTTLYYAGPDAPPRPFAAQIIPSGWSTGGSFDVTWGNPWVPSYIQAAWYKWGGAPTHSEDGTRVAGVGIQSISSLSPGTQGRNQLHIWLEDAASNKDHANLRTLDALYDAAPPSTYHVYSPALPPGGWYSYTVGVTLVASDEFGGLEVSGVDETRWQRDGSAWTVGTSFSATSYQVYRYYSQDVAGNVEATHVITVPIDRVAPISSIDISPPPPASGWFTGPVTIDLSATDGLSGWAGDSAYRVDGGAWQAGTTAVIGTAGYHAIGYFARDRAGNAETPQTIAEVCKIDMQAPTVTATPNKTGTWVVPPVQIALAAQDDLSGVAVIESRREGETEWMLGNTIYIDGSEGDGTYVYHYRARDAAGNVSPIETISTHIDGTPPIAPINLASSPTGWTNLNGSFALTWSNTPDPYSGIAGVYYQIDTDPTVVLSPTFEAGVGIESLADLEMPDEGIHTIYIWLKDEAGNSDPYSRRAWEDAFMLDISAPELDGLPVVEGPLGCSGYYTGPVTVAIEAEDTLSGLTALHYRIDSGAWVTETVPSGDTNAQHVVPLGYASGRYTMVYRASDVAGNVSEASDPVTMRFDTRPPAAPIDLSGSPDSWTNVNSFELSWENPSDYTGIAAAYYKVGSAPVSPHDGQRRTGNDITSVSGVTVVDEGETPVYLWLQDVACNTQHTSAASVTLRYDATSPETIIVVPEPDGRNGYYVSPVTFHFESNDANSGVVTTHYAVNGGNPQLWGGGEVTLSQEGEYTITYWSTDRAGNVENTHSEGPIRIDLTDPTVLDLWVPGHYTGDDSVDVAWAGEDGLSGIEKYTVQYRQGGCGDNWQPWLVDTANTWGTFGNMLPNYFYYFRVKAYDRAGRDSGWTTPGTSDYVYREGLTNGTFDSCAIGPWIAGGEMPVSIVTRQKQGGAFSCMIRLGDELPSDALQSIGAYGSVYQQIQLPTINCDRPLTLTLTYRIQSYDTAWSWDYEGLRYDWFDPFEIYIRDINGFPLARFLPDGNNGSEGHPGSWTIDVLYDSGWRESRFDLSAWAGQTIRIEFRISNLIDVQWPSWVFVDDVRLEPGQPHSVRIPFVVNAGTMPPSGESNGSGLMMRPAPWDGEGPKPRLGKR